VTNGIIALPTTPRQANMPIVPVCKSPGMISIMIKTQEGYMGPIKTPMSDMLTAEPISEGTNQTTNSSARQMAELLISTLGMMLTSGVS
jgi:hypothetical protein